MDRKYKFFIACSLCCAISVALSSCKFEEDDYFDEEAALRIENTAISIKSTLVAPEQGWVMQYFCGTGTAHFEGFNILARFNADNAVTLASNHRYLRNNNAGKYIESASLYEILLEDGPVLAFNTWNDVLTPFVDPVSPWQAPRTINKDGAGMRGDNNLVVMSYSDKEVLLRGERHGGLTRLIPCDRPWEQYLKDCDSIKNAVSNSAITAYYIAESGDTSFEKALYITGLNNGGRLRYSERLDDPFKNDSLSAVFTPKGFRLERADTINGNLFQEFFLADDMTCLQTEDGKVKIVPCWDLLIINRTAVWNFDMEQFSAEQKRLLEQIDAEFKAFNSTYELTSVGLGRSSGAQAIKGLVFSFTYTNKGKKANNTAGVALDITRPKYGQLQLAISEEGTMDKNMQSICSKSNAEQLVQQFVASLSGKYRITPNDYFNPTECELQQIIEKEDGTEELGSIKYTLK